MRPVAAVLAFVVCVAAILAFYRWTAHTTGLPTSFNSPVSNDRYNQLVDSFGDGRLDLELPVPSGLTALRDPYDTFANAPYRATGYQDLSYRDGRLYMYWGPAPALTLFWPSRALGAGRFPQVLAVALFASLAFVCAAGLLWTLTRRFAPATPLWMQLVAVLALGAGGLWAWLIRRPDVYEVAVAAASAFMFAGLWLLAVGGLGRRARPVALAAGMLCLGLGIGSRVIVAAALLAPLALLLWRRRGDPPRRWARTVAAMAVPLVVCAVALMIYNQRRFGSPTDFGTSYMLRSPDDAARGASLTNVPSGLWFYLLGQLHFLSAFPYFHVESPAGAPFHVPAFWAVRDRAGGLLTMQPFLLVLAAGPALRGRLRGLGAVVAVLAAIAAVMLLFDAYWVNGITQRYEADFTPLLLVAAALTWFGLRERLAAPLAGASLAWAGAALALFGAAAGALLSTSGPDATLPLGWEHVEPKLRFLAPIAHSVGWSGVPHEAWRLAVLVAIGPAVMAATTWLARRVPAPATATARQAGLVAALAGAAIVALAVLLPRGDAATDPFGTGRALAVLAGVVVGLAGAALRAGAASAPART